MHHDSRHKFDMFEEPDYGASKSQDILTSLWRNILHTRAIRPIEISDLMSQFLKDPRHQQIFLGKSLTSLRGNMRRALLKDHRMSWRWFERGINMLAPVKAKFILELEWPDGELTRHEQKIVINDPNQMDLFDDIEESKSDKTPFFSNNPLAAAYRGVRSMFAKEKKTDDRS